MPMSLTNEDKQWIDERLEALETKLLTAFHQWASPVQTRQKSHSAALRAMEELEEKDARVRKLEGS